MCQEWDLCFYLYFCIFSRYRYYLALPPCNEPPIRMTSFLHKEDFSEMLALFYLKLHEEVLSYVLICHEEVIRKMVIYLPRGGSSLNSRLPCIAYLPQGGPVIFMSGGGPMMLIFLRQISGRPCHSVKSLLSLRCCSSRCFLLLGSLCLS